MKNQHRFNTIKYKVIIPTPHPFSPAAKAFIPKYVRAAKHQPEEHPATV
jgi:hypothetical protein